MSTKSENEFRALEYAGLENQDAISPKSRIVQDFSGYHWKMERMRPGQGVAEGIPLLENELSGNDFSWNTAHVPGDVYTDLHRAGEIDDPVFGRNMGRIKWVQDYEWWYIYAFNVEEEMKGKDLTLLFEGVDYSCEVWLNTKYLGKHTGMLSSFQFDVTDIIDFKQPHVPSNILAIKLDPPPKNQKNIAGMKHNFAGDYLTGLIPFGIWKPVKLIATEKVRIENYRLDTKVCGNDAKVTIECEVTGLREEQKELTIGVSLKEEGNTYVLKQKGIIEKGKNTFKFEMTVPNAKLWWPYELGEPNLYDIRLTVEDEEKVLDEIEEKVGLREIRMEMNPGFTSEEVENPWTFVINNKPMFLRSACWGGQPSFFYGRNSYEKYRFYLEKAKECNINNLRMFGWHPPETEEFYSICDELGITVWTNFPFATQVFREDEEYINAVLHEVEMTVKDRRNHCSNIMWMGGEEVYFSEAHVESGNKKLMQLVGDVTRSLTNVPYADASPLSSREGIRMGYKPKESAHANSHYYAAGAITMEDFYKKLDYAIIPELTAASSPNVSSLKKFIPENELWPIGPSWGYHAGDMHILETLNYEVFGSKCDDSLENFVRATQIAQGTIFQFALEHFRRCKPRVSGVALCHFITNWPIIKWDLIDYYGEKKISYDFVKRSYQPLLVSMDFDKRRWLPGETLDAKLWIVNDYYKEYKGLTLSYEIYDEKDKLLDTKTISTEIGINDSKKVGELSWKVTGEIGEKFKVKLFLYGEEGKEISHNEYTLLIDDQERAKLELKKLYIEGREAREKYGRGYYRYAPQYL